MRLTYQIFQSVQEYVMALIISNIALLSIIGLRALDNEKVTVEFLKTNCLFLYLVLLGTLLAICMITMFIYSKYGDKRVFENIKDQLCTISAYTLAFFVMYYVGIDVYIKNHEQIITYIGILFVCFIVCLVAKTILEPTGNEISYIKIETKNTENGLEVENVIEATCNENEIANIEEIKSQLEEIAELYSENKNELPRR